MEPAYADAAETALENDRRAVLARSTASARESRARKQTIDWELIQRDWADYFANEAPDNWRDEFFPLLIGTTEGVNDIWTEELGIQFNVQNLVESAALEYQVYSMTFSEPILETTEKDLFALLKTAAEGGWTIEQLNNGIDDLFKEYLDADFDLTEEQREWFVNRRPEYRVETIARTETMHASNFASSELFRAYGAERHEWNATGDNRTRPTHAAADGQVVTIGQPFEVGNSLMLFPLDGSLGAPAEEIVSCRCITTPSFDEGDE